MPGENMQFSETKELCTETNKNKQFKWAWVQQHISTVRVT